MLLVVSLVSVEHAVEPREKLVGTVVGVEHDGDTVEGSDSSIGSGLAVSPRRRAR